MWLLRIAEELSIGLNSAVEDSPFVLSSHNPDCVILLSKAFFLLKAIFASKTFTLYHYYSRKCSGCRGVEARGQMRARPRTLSWHGIEYTI